MRNQPNEYTINPDAESDFEKIYLENDDDNVTL